MRAHSFLSALGVVAVAIVAFLVAHVGVRMYQLRGDYVRDRGGLVVLGGNDPSGTDWRGFVMLYVGPDRRPCPFLIDTGFAGPTVINPAVLSMSPRDHLEGWVNAIETGKMPAQPSDDAVPGLLGNAGIKYTGTETRLLSSLSGTHEVTSARGSTIIAMSPQGNPINRDVVVEYVPGTPSILTFTDMARMRICVLDMSGSKEMHIQIGMDTAPVGTAWPVQNHNMGVTAFQCRINQTKVWLVADTGFGGAIGLNSARKDVVVNGDACTNVLHATVKQIDVRAHEVCAAVGMADVTIDYEDGRTAALGKLPINLNASDIDGADGLIGLAALRRLAPLVVDVRTLFHVPQLGTCSPARDTGNWTPELIHAQFRAPSDQCDTLPVTPCS